MEIEGSMTRSQESAIVLYPQPNESNTHFHILFNIHFNNIFSFTPESSKQSLYTLRFSDQSFVCNCHI
jgi:hypothetical protein